MKPFLLLFFSLITFSKPHAQKGDKALEKQLKSLAASFHGDIGIYVKNLKTGRITAVNADTVFPTASMVKVPILIAIMDKMQRNQLSYHQELVYHDSLLYEGVDLLGSFKSGEKIELSKVLMLMMTMSDNTASLWLQGLAGSGTRINALMDSMGFLKTRVNTRTPGREEARIAYGWGQTTPREMATMLEQIDKGALLSKGASDRMLRSLNKNYWDGESLSQIPPKATVFSKNGAVNASRSEVALVHGKKSHYVFCICTKNIKDQSWDEKNEAWQLMRAVSALLWSRYEKNNNWQPAADANRYH